MHKSPLYFAIALGLTACATSKGEVPAVITPAPPPPIETSDAADVPSPGPAPVETYDETWAVKDFWSGEWPDGFTVISDSVVVWGRAHAHPSHPADKPCKLSKNMNVNPWNGARVESDKWEFLTANKRTEITLTEDVSLETGWSEKPNYLDLKAGDIVMYDAYLAEGYFLGSFEGVEHELSESDFIGIAEFETGGETHEWVNVACDGDIDNRAWLLLSDMKDTFGIGPVAHESFGYASDLDKGSNDIQN